MQKHEKEGARSKLLPFRTSKAKRAVSGVPPGPAARRRPHCLAFKTFSFRDGNEQKLNKSQTARSSSRSERASARKANDHDSHSSQRTHDTSMCQPTAQDATAQSTGTLVCVQRHKVGPRRGHKGVAQRYGRAQTSDKTPGVWIAPRTMQMAERSLS